MNWKFSPCLLIPWLNLFPSRLISGKGCQLKARVWDIKASTYGIMLSYRGNSYFIFINNHVYNLNQSYTNSLSADNKPRIVYLLAKNCSDKSKLKRLQGKYRKKQNKVYVREWSYFTVNRAGDPRMFKLPLRGEKKCFLLGKKKN